MRAERLGERAERVARRSDHKRRCIWYTRLLASVANGGGGSTSSHPGRGRRRGRGWQAAARCLGRTCRAQRSREPSVEHAHLERSRTFRMTANAASCSATDKRSRGPRVVEQVGQQQARRCHRFRLRRIARPPSRAPNRRVRTTATLGLLGDELVGTHAGGERRASLLAAAAGFPPASGQQRGIITTPGRRRRLAAAWRSTARGMARTPRCRRRD